jgi:hypothetical protein
MIEDMTVRNFAPNKQQSYLQEVSLFAQFFAKPPEQLGPEQIRTYQIYVAKDRKVAAGTRPGRVLRLLQAAPSFSHHVIFGTGHRQRATATGYRTSSIPSTP